MKFIHQSGLWLLPLIALLLVTPWLSELDIQTSSLFFKNGFYSNAFFDVLYDYGNLFSQILCCSAGALFLFSFKYRNLSRFRSITLVMMISYVLGAGFLGHFLLKDHWGRARPVDVCQFHGKKTFTPYYKPNFSHPQGKSFPSGHAISGFYYFCLFFALQRRALKIASFFFACFLGALLSLARIAQGGHFLSDVLFSCLLMWEVGFFTNLFVSKYLSGYIHDFDQKTV